MLSNFRNRQIQKKILPTPPQQQILVILHMHTWLNEFGNINAKGYLCMCFHFRSSKKMIIFNAFGNFLMKSLNKLTSNLVSFGFIFISN